MKKVLGQKQRISNEQWLEAMDQIEELVSREELDELTEKTIADIKEKTAGKKVAYSWSGGKDSIVLGDICEKAGIKDCELVICDLEYPAFVEWAHEYGPERLEIINMHQDLAWLQKHPQMLFPQDAKAAGQWFHIVQHRGQAKYYKEHGLDMILLGRRKADGNYVGKGTNIYTNAQGVTRFSPLADWPHEMILAYIHYHKLPLPPIYDWKNGYLCGTHPWPSRQWTGSIENGWQEVYDIDPTIVEGASAYIPSAFEFLKGVKHD